MTPIKTILLTLTLMVICCNFFIFFFATNFKMRVYSDNFVEWRGKFKVGAYQNFTRICASPVVKLKDAYNTTYYTRTYYSTIYNASVSEQPSICLATHGTLDRLYWIPQQNSQWNGPFSVSVFVTRQWLNRTQFVIEHLYSCVPNIKTFITFTLVFDKTFLGTLSRKPYAYTVPCETFFSFLFDDIMVPTKENHSTIYPQNLMRNVARNQCQTTHTLNVDIDMIVNHNLAEKLNDFLSRTKQCKTCAFIVPVYEIDNNSPFPPANKEQLRQLLKSKRAQRYHIKVYKPNQGNTNLKKWEIMRSKNSSAVNVLYEVKTYKEFWEPIVVLHRSAPPFPEQFLGYGRTRSSHIYLMHKMKFAFFVLDNAFLSHLGFQTSKHYSKQRIDQIYKNIKTYKAFKKKIQKGSYKEYT